MNIPIANFISRKKQKKKREKRGGHMIKCLLTDLGRAGRENIWPSVMAHGPRCARSVRHDHGPNIFPSSPPTQSVSTYSHTIARLPLTDKNVQYCLICLICLLLNEMLLNFTVRRTNPSQPLQSKIKFFTQSVQLILSLYHSVFTENELSQPDSGSFIDSH